MDIDTDIVQELNDVLKEIGLKTKLRTERIARSIAYDADYHICLITCSFSIHAVPGPDRARQILAPWLKMLGFVAARPEMARDLKEWVGSRCEGSLESLMKMPRGYLGDHIHDSTIEFLVARGVFRRGDGIVIAGPRIQELDSWMKQITEAELFTSERTALQGLLGLRASRAMLEAR
jgi:hypothetical protein